MKTYSETKKHKKFNWYDFLNRANEGKATEGEIANAKDDSEDWVTCAVGNQCAIIPRDEDDSPIDNTLYKLGSDFMDDILDEKWKKAIKTLDKIEKRSTILIQKELDKMINNIKGQGYKVTKA